MLSPPCARAVKAASEGVQQVVCTPEAALSQSGGVEGMSTRGNSLRSQGAFLELFPVGSGLTREIQALGCEVFNPPSCAGVAQSPTSPCVPECRLPAYRKECQGAKSTLAAFRLPVACCRWPKHKG